MLNTRRLAEQVSQAFCVALTDYLDQLFDSGLTKISLRVSLDVEKVSDNHLNPPDYSFIIYKFVYYLDWL